MQQEHLEADTGLDFTVGIITEAPRKQRLFNGHDVCMFSIKPMRPVGTSSAAQNAVWPVIVFRPSSVGTLAAAEPGDMIEITGRVQNTHIIVPRNDGRIDYLSYR